MQAESVRVPSVIRERVGQFTGALCMHRHQRLAALDGPADMSMQLYARRLRPRCTGQFRNPRDQPIVDLGDDATGG
jgi:hypothetical protein